MELPNFGQGGMLNGLKSKLGLGNKDEEYYDDYEDDYEEGYEDDYEEYDDYHDDYREYDNRSTQPSPYATSTRSNRSESGVTRPRLVSFDEIRASTQLDVNASAPQNNAPRYAAGDPAQVGYGADQSVSRMRSEGLNSLFEPTTDAASAGRSQNSYFSESPLDTTATMQVASSPRQAVSPLDAQPTLRLAGASFDPYESYTGTSNSVYAPTRSMNVIKPVSYGDVEKVARTVRSGNVVVLNLRNTQDALSKRILDFSFGVASALDARVDCIADKVFAVNCGEALSQVEIQNLKNQGAF